MTADGKQGICTGNIMNPTIFTRVANYLDFIYYSEMRNTYSYNSLDAPGKFFFISENMF